MASSKDAFQQVGGEKAQKKQIILSQMLLLPAILAQWRQPVASAIALDPLHLARMPVVLYRRTAMASKMACKDGVFLYFFSMQPRYPLG